MASRFGMVKGSLTAENCSAAGLGEVLAGYPWFVWVMLALIPAWAVIAWWERNPSKIPRFYRNAPMSMAIINQGLGLIFVAFGMCLIVMLSSDIAFKMSYGVVWWWLRQVSVAVLVITSFIGVSVFFFARPRFLTPSTCRPEALRDRYRRWSTASRSGVRAGRR